jgi:hypothetical protein
MDGSNVSEEPAASTFRVIYTYITICLLIVWGNSSKEIERRAVYSPALGNRILT